MAKVATVIGANEYDIAAEARCTGQTLEISASFDGVYTVSEDNTSGVRPTHRDAETTLLGSTSRTYTRAPLDLRGANQGSLPEEGAFWLAQPCCCRCRWLLIGHEADDETAEGWQNNARGGAWSYQRFPLPLEKPLAWHYESLLFYSDNDEIISSDTDDSTRVLPAEWDSYPGQANEHGTPEIWEACESAEGEFPTTRQRRQMEFFIGAPDDWGLPVGGEWEGNITVEGGTVLPGSEDKGSSSASCMVIVDTCGDGFDVTLTYSVAGTYSGVTETTAWDNSYSLTSTLRVRLMA